MKIKLGQKMEVIKGLGFMGTSMWLSTGDIVKVIDIYRHHVLVERPYKKNPNKTIKESFTLVDIHKYLKPVKENYNGI